MSRSLCRARSAAGIHTSTSLALASLIASYGVLTTSLSVWNSLPQSNTASVSTATVPPASTPTVSSGTLSYAPTTTTTSYNGQSLPSQYNIQGYGSGGWSSIATSTSTSYTVPTSAFYACYRVVGSASTWSATPSGSVSSGISQSFTAPLSGPENVAYDPVNGDFYVTNLNSSAILIIDPVSNSYVGEITSSYLVQPDGITYDSTNGDFYVTNQNGGSVSVIDPVNNSYVTTIANSNFGEPIGIAYDSTTGNVYVADSGSAADSVSLIDPTTNTYVSSIVGLTDPVSVGVDSSGNVWVGSGTSGYIWVIAPTTNAVTTLNGFSSTVTGFAYDPNNGNMYAAGNSGNDVGIYNASTFAYVGVITGAFSGPEGIVYAPVAQNMYVSDYGNSTITAFSPNTNGTDVLTSININKPIGLAYGHSEVYAVNNVGNSVSIIDAASNADVGEIPSTPFGDPVGSVYVPSNGNFYIANMSSDSISVQNASTGLYIGNILATGAFAGGLDEPSGIVYDPSNGDIYVTDYNNAVSVIDPSTNSYIATITNSGFSSPGGIYYDSTNGYLYMANHGNNTLSVFDPANNTYIATVTSSGFNYPYAITQASNGDLYVTNANGDSVTVINPATNQVIDQITSTGFNSPEGLAVAPNGDIYVTNYDGDSVSVIDPSTNAVVTTISDSNLINGATSIVIGANGWAYLPSYYDNTVAVINTATNTYIGSITNSTFDKPNLVEMIPSTSFGYAINKGSQSDVLVGPCL